MDSLFYFLFVSSPFFFIWLVGWLGFIKQRIPSWYWRLSSPFVLVMAYLLWKMLQSLNVSAAWEIERKTELCLLVEAQCIEFVVCFYGSLIFWSKVFHCEEDKTLLNNCALPLMLLESFHWLSSLVLLSIDNSDSSDLLLWQFFSHLVPNWSWSEMNVEIR